jgi:ketosteroid isomerase-like protein
VITRESAHALVTQLLDAAGQHDLARLMVLYAENAVAISPVFGEVIGKAAIAETWEMLFLTLTDLRVEVSDLLVDGDRIAVMSSIATSGRAGWFGAPGGGGPIGYRLVLMLTVADGKIIRDERIYDSTGVVERLEKARRDREMRTAADVQRALQSREPHVAGFCESVGHSMPCRAIGGDFFDFMTLPSGEVGVALGDVAGKGPAAALLAAMLQGMFCVEAPTGGGPAATLSRMNQRLAARHVEARFATLFYGVLSANGTLVYTNAGHNPPVLLTRDGIHRLTAGGPVLGLFADATFEQETIEVKSQDTLVMFTDGVTEARSASDEEFGELRLMQCLSGAPRSSPVALLNGIFSTLREFCLQADQSDDITATVTRYIETPR